MSAAVNSSTASSWAAHAAWAGLRHSRRQSSVGPITRADQQPPTTVPTPVRESLRDLPRLRPGHRLDVTV